MQVINLKLLFVSLIAVLGSWAFAPLALAQGFDTLGQSCSATKLDDKGNVVPNPAASGPVCKQKTDQQTKKDNPVVRTIHTATNILGGVAGIGAVIIIIYSGFVFVTAGGGLGGSRSGDNPTRARQARSSLFGALIGLIIVALSWSIITFFTNRLL